MKKSKLCPCQFSVQFRFLNALLPKVPKGYRKRLREFFDWAWTESEELEYKSCVLDGSWPSSVEQLERYLMQAKKKRQEEERCLVKT